MIPEDWEKVYESIAIPVTPKELAGLLTSVQGRGYK